MAKRVPSLDTMSGNTPQAGAPRLQTPQPATSDGTLPVQGNRTTTTMSAEQSRPIQRLASALQDCLDEATRKGAREAAREVKDELMPRLDRQDDTLRLMWKQMKGNGKLPIDG